VMGEALGGTSNEPRYRLGQMVAVHARHDAT
jgi:hypothetical protein